MTSDPKMPEPVAFIDSLQRGRPDCVTDLKYCSVLQHERGDHLKYIPVITTDAAQAYAEALAEARVAQERERWRALLEARAAGCERAAENTEDPKFDLMARVLMSVRKDGSVASNVRSSCQQPPETGRGQR